MIEIDIEETDYGTTFQFDGGVAYFGSSQASLELLPTLFPSLSFSTLHQIHGNKCIEITTPVTYEIQADAHFTQQSEIALVIKTADCQPILLFDLEAKIACAIHAGWRGVVNGVIEKSVRSLLNPEKSLAFIGPSISQDHFEVDKDVAEQIKAVDPTNGDNIKIVPPKYHPNLPQISRDKLVALGLNPDNIWTSNDDTFSNNRYYSHRENQTPHRNFSFISKLS